MTWILIGSALVGGLIIGTCLGAHVGIHRYVVEYQKNERVLHLTKAIDATGCMAAEAEDLGYADLAQCMRDRKRELEDVLRTIQNGK